MLDEKTQSREEILHQTVDRFWETIPPIWNRVRSNLRGNAEEHFGITVEQFHILRHINHGVNSVSDLAEERCISRPAISHVVDVLANKGLLTRQHDVDDRRYVKLVLTENGAALLKGIYETNRNWLMSKLESLSLDELAACNQAMETLKTTFEDIFI
jgi:DNA-binding MarR family transcriptional regulator